MSKIINFVKKETILSISLILAVISSLFVIPNKNYLNYIDYRTILLLFTLMGITQGLKKLNVFNILGHKLLNRCHSINSLIFILWGLCFVFSMLITNDVALITFVPFSIVVLELLGDSYKKKWLIPTVVLQTIAANLGSMLTPIGNPQNLYLYEKSNHEFMDFLTLMLPYTIISLVLLVITTLLLTKNKNESTEELVLPLYEIPENKIYIIIYLILFILCIFSVLHFLSILVPLICTIFFIAFFDRDIFKKIDFSLLLTFVGFFIFVGNIKNISAFQNYVESIIDGQELIVSIISSQIISNVPAAILLSAFTDNIDLIILGTNIGGLGTLIASMASLISFKYIAKDNKENRIIFFKKFTVLNIMFLFILSVFAIIMN
ncbi:MAG: SLC13 family permease [Oscillospiraceae bacterium]|nr:SLC13 family permease [Oscillospiraceae bacterium]